MRLIRGLGGVLLWILASVLGLVAVILCVTVILLPVGLPLLRLAGKSYGTATRLMLPRAVAHPVKETRRSWRKKGKAAKDAAPDVPSDLAFGRLWKKGRKKVKRKRGLKRLIG